MRKIAALENGVENVGQRKLLLPDEGEERFGGGSGVCGARAPVRASGGKGAEPVGVMIEA
ncbi:hypothetical protein WOC76_05290 [Methylocystis sp. IM3]|uniref:hypothetical protein n=1 Tax=unclassified Methylocystis TaxID=2625913 RepID=UPI0030F66A00